MQSPLLVLPPQLHTKMITVHMEYNLILTEITESVDSSHPYMYCIALFAYKRRLSKDDCIVYRGPFTAAKISRPSPSWMHDTALTLDHPGMDASCAGL